MLAIDLRKTNFQRTRLAETSVFREIHPSARTVRDLPPQSVMFIEVKISHF